MSKVNRPPISISRIVKETRGANPEVSVRRAFLALASHAAATRALT
jgi:hypothetical protein